MIDLVLELKEDPFLGLVCPVVVNEFGESFVQRGERVGVVVL